ncbi:unnamed protein product [Mytilus coruscus]|uniref:BTB domain-containing protein n=1 Tax=Mytilus coruscus TaxID=42192 RepID=A0A6J8BVJ3_MYTCO|nr:unnamed protein product [Mytilus coruscus]
MSSMTDDLDWQLNKTLPECMLYMLEHEILCDISFRVGPEHRIRKAHKYMLCSRSPVFYIMMQGSLPETDDIDVPDVDAETFRVLLEHIYSDSVAIPKDKVGKVLYASEKYMLPKLKCACEQLLQTLATSSDAPIVLQTAHSFNMTDLLHESLQHILQSPKQCLNSEDALNISADCMEMILSSDELMLSEAAVFTFLLQWATYRCMTSDLEISDQDIRETMSSLLYCVRFPCMEQDFFTTEVSTKDILSKDELLSIYRSFNGIKSEIFSELKRKEPVANRVIRYSSLSSTGSWISNEQDAVTLTCSKPVFLKSILSFGTKAATACLSPGVEIRDSTGAVLSSVQRDISVGFCETFDIDFPQPVHLMANVMYTVISKGVSRNVYYGDNCKNVVNVKDMTFTFGDSIQSKTATSAVFGQIAGFTFHL